MSERIKFYRIDVYLPDRKMDRNGRYLGYCNMRTITINASTISTMYRNFYEVNGTDKELTKISMVNGEIYFSEQTPDDLMKYFYSDSKVYKVLYGKSNV